MSMAVKPEVSQSDEGKWEEFEVTHWEWRDRVYTPETSARDQVGRFRITKGQYEGGEEFVVSDEWRSETNSSRLMNRKWKRNHQVPKESRCGWAWSA